MLFSRLSIFLFSFFASALWAQSELRIVLSDSSGQQRYAGFSVALYQQGEAGLLFIDRQKTDSVGQIHWPSLLPGSYRLQAAQLPIEFPVFALEEGYATLLSLRLGSKPSLLGWKEEKREAGLAADLRAVEIDGRQRRLYAEAPLSSRLNSQDILASGKGTLAASLERLPGVSSISLGVGIAKPVIRGLWGNRIQVLYQDIAQQSQQWGSDHGLELDPFEPEEVEVLRGPSSLRYGSDALGGTVQLWPRARRRSDGLSIDLHKQYKSNNGHWAQSMRLAHTKGPWSTALRYTRQSFADYRVPAESFVYNGFELPLYEQRLKNTAGLEQQAGVWLGHEQGRQSIELSGQYYHLDGGIFAGAVGIPRSYALRPDSSWRDRQLPKQSISHLRLSGQYQYRDEENILRWVWAYQDNNRREWSYPHIHNRPSTDSTFLALAMELKTLSTRLRWHRGKSQEYGGDLQYQWHGHSGFEFLLPAYSTLRSGIYTIQGYSSPNERHQFEFGLRLDYGMNSYQSGGVYAFDEWGAELYQPRVEGDRSSYFNYAASALWQQELIANSLKSSLQVAKSFRLPYINELASNGVHHGTFRHELGNAALVPEQGYQLDWALQGQWGEFQSRLNLFAQYFDGFIYLRPSGRFSPLPEAGQIYSYSQDDVFYWGGEWEYYWQPLPYLRLEQAYELLYNRNRETGLPLPFTPPASIRSELVFDYPSLEPGQLSLSLSQHYRFAQNRVDRNERATPASSIWDLSVGGFFSFSGQKLSWRISAQNLFNSAYMLHLSRYRLLNLPEQGRNIVLSIHYSLE